MELFFKINKFMDVEVYEGSSTHDNHMFLWDFVLLESISFKYPYDIR